MTDGTQGRASVFYNLISEVTGPHFCCIRLVTQHSVGGACTGYDDQEVEPLGTHWRLVATEQLLEVLL